jgi:PPOX class probable F420-dependent enzyme
MAAIPESVRAVLESGALAHFVTLNKSGTPQVTCVWVGVQGDEVVSAHLFEHQKVRNVRRDGRVAFSMQAEGLNAFGLQNYLVVNGRARIEEGGAPELLQDLAQRYLGPGVKFPPMPNPPAGYIMRITPERFGGVGPWAEGGG